LEKGILVGKKLLYKEGYPVCEAVPNKTIQSILKNKISGKSDLSSMALKRTQIWSETPPIRKPKKLL
jgi:hypothetical protein